MGEAIALGLAAEGATVVVAGRRQAKLDEVAAQAGGTILTHTVDVADRASVKTLFDWVGGQLGQLHLLVNCAGANVPKRSMSELAPDDWDKLMAINATGAFNCMHYALPLMRPHKTGLVINISSTSGKRAAPLGGVAYNASKFAMAALGTSANEDERENGIRVTTIFPGEVDTPILSKPTGAAVGGASRENPESRRHRGHHVGHRQAAAAGARAGAGYQADRSVVHLVAEFARASKFIPRSLAEVGYGLIKLLEQLGASQTRRSSSRFDDGVAFVFIHENRRIQQSLFLPGRYRQEAVLVGVDQLAGLNPLPEDLHLATPVDWNHVCMPHAQPPGQCLEPGIGHLINIPYRAIRDGSDASECAMNVCVDLAPEGTGRGRLVQILHNDDLGPRDAGDVFAIFLISTRSACLMP